MEITEVRIKLMEHDEDRLLGFCSITIDRAFVVRDLKIIRGTKGAFVAMPSRKLTDRCPGCGGKNQLRAAFCNHCGRALDDDRSHKQPDGKAKLYADIAHPIHSDCRDAIQDAVIAAYDEELILAHSPDYVCRYDDYGEFSAPDDSNHAIPVTTGTRDSQHDSSVRHDRAQNGKFPHRANEPTKRKRKHSDDFGAGLF